MGNRFTIEVWTRDGNHSFDYKDKEYWRGESLIKMIIQMIKAKKRYGCVTLKWRS